MYPRDLTITVQRCSQSLNCKNPQMFFTDGLPSVMNGNTLRILSPFHYWNNMTLPSANSERRMNGQKVWRQLSIMNWWKLEQRLSSWERNWHCFAVTWHKAACHWTGPKTLLSLTHQRKVFGNVTRHLVPRGEKRYENWRWTLSRNFRQSLNLSR